MSTKVTSINAGTKRRRADLESRLSQISNLSAERESLEIQQMADPVDQVQAHTDRDMAVETLNQQAHSIHEIHAALARIDEGSYGRCERCDAQIPPKRLDALPWARMCVHCQSMTEAKASQGHSLSHSAA